MLVADSRQVGAGAHHKGKVEKEGAVGRAEGKACVAANKINTTGGGTSSRRTDYRGKRLIWNPAVVGVTFLLFIYINVSKAFGVGGIIEQNTG